MAAPDKAVLGLLNGLAKREYYNEDDISDEFLQSELYEGVAEEEFKSTLKRFQGILSTLAISDMSFGQLEAYLTSQMKRREASQNLSPGQAASVMKFWKSHKTKIHDAVIERNSFSTQLKNINWRIDLKGQERYAETSHEPCAVVELHTGQSLGEKKPEKLQFEMNLEQVNSMVESLNNIENKIGHFCQEDQA